MPDYQIDQLNLGVNVNIGKSVSNTKRLTEQLEKLDTVINKLGIDKLNFDAGAKGSKSSSTNSKNSIFNVANIYHIVRLFQFAGRAMQKVGSIMQNLLQYGMDYTETLNLWQVAMGKNVDEAEDFVNRMADAYGYATKTIMQYQATFRNMLSSLGGVDSNVSYKLSEYLMQMAGDFASLYNLSIEKAMQTFQSVLAGQVRPVRSISGYDITENTIYELYQSLGGEKTMRQLSATEKRLLRIYAVFQQMERSGAVGDLAKTLQNSANQVRIINEEMTELKTWLGNIFELYLRPVLPIVNAFLIVATEVAKVIAKDLGYKAFDGTIAGLEETNDQVDELSGKLLSFDKFEALNSATGENTMGIDSVLLEGMARYDSIMDDVGTIAQAIAEQWLPKIIDENGNLIGIGAKIRDTIQDSFGWLQKLYVVNEDGSVNFEATWEKATNILKSIPAILTTIITLLSGTKLTNGLGKIKDALGSIKLTAFGKDLEEKIGIADEFTQSSGKIPKLLTSSGWLVAIAAIAGALVYLYKTNDGVKKSIDDLLSALKPIAQLFIDLVKNLLPSIGSALQSLAPVVIVLVDIISMLVYVLNAISTIFVYVGELLLKAIMTIVELFNFNGKKDLGKRLSNLWGDWSMSQNFANSTLNSEPSWVSSPSNTSFVSNSTTSDVTSASNSITQGVYNGVVASSTQMGNNTIEGVVVLNGEKVGRLTAQSSYQENVRVGNLTAKK